MQPDDNLFFPKELVCPVCEQSFLRSTLRRKQFAIGKRDIDYRPVFRGTINPRQFGVAVCPHCFYAGEDPCFCPRMSDDDRRRKDYFDSHRAQWDVQSHVRAAAGGKHPWKDLAAERLKEMSSEELAVLRRISPLLRKSAADLIALGRPVNELQREGHWLAAVRSWELAAICYKARGANQRILGYTYLAGAWTSRDARAISGLPAEKERYRDLETAYLREAVSFLTAAHQVFLHPNNDPVAADRIAAERLPEARAFELMYILAGAHRLLGNIAESDAFLRQILVQAPAAQGLALWFVQEAREMPLIQTGQGPCPGIDGIDDSSGDDGNEEEDPHEDTSRG